ncbi:MAG TPA: glycosyltransferase N-terminal domain-containing protein, partial [Usitatibacter sp.]|nr:glycosyltransferase N-terminal domain-containing protein [Usitatibacter sp.]
MASRKMEGLAPVFFAPLDSVRGVRRVLRALRPSLVIVMETEIWPNLYREAKRAGAGLLLINGRISDRALPRYQSLRWFFGPVLSHPDLILAQSEEMRRRLLSAGAPPDRVVVGGNLKYDAEPVAAPPDSPVRGFIERLDPGAVWIAASTMPPALASDPDEDDEVIAAFQRLAGSHPRLLMVLAPRRPERFDTAAQALSRAAIPFVRRSALAPSSTLPLPGVLLLDSIGELSGLFPLADVVFMGGTLPTRGGHNILEPALFARPIVIGPHMENFPEIAADFRAAGALVDVCHSIALADAVGGLLDDPAGAAALGSKAESRARARQGATALAVRHAREIFAGRAPLYRPSQP